MMKKKIEYANFVCRFGGDLVLADQLQEVVFPAFLNKYAKETKKTKFFLHEVSIVRNSEERHVIAGRLVKDTILEREKLYDSETETLKNSTQSLRSSPTAFFALILETHRLIFVPEHRGSPTLKTFETVMQKFLLDAYISRYGKKSTSRTPSAKAAENPPPPELEIVPMMSAHSLENFLGRFALIQQLAIRVAEVNNEFDNSELIEDLRKSHRKMQAKQTELRYKNTSEGLSSQEVKAELIAVGKGTGHVNVVGRDSDGRKIEGNNEKFGIKSELESFPDDVESAIDVTLREFDKLLKAGTLDPGNAPPSTKSKVKEAYDSKVKQNDFGKK